MWTDRYLWLRRAEATLKMLGIACLAFWGVSHAERLAVKAAADEQLSSRVGAHVPVDDRPVGLAAPVDESVATLETADLETADLAPPPRPRPAVGDLVARIAIPRLELEAVALHGTDESTLRRAVGHFEHSPVPGERGNVAFAGHRDADFRALEGVEVGDDVFVDTTEGRFAYRVTETHVVDPSEFEVVENRGVDEVTLITCYPFRHVGPAPTRFVVHAEAVEPSDRATVDVAASGSFAPDAVSAR